MSRTIPRWQSAIEQGLAKYKGQNVTQMATLEQNISGGVVPRLRSVVIRKFLAPQSNHGLPLILTTTDIRTPKVDQLLADEHMELVWWMEGTNQQFRIKGSAYIVPSKEYVHLGAKFNEALACAPPESALHEFRVHPWFDTLAEVFKSLGPGMRASWARPTPPPGSVLEGGTESWPERLDEPDPTKEGYEEATRLWKLALSRFALVIIDPEEAEMIDLATNPDKRTLFTKKEGAPGVWEETALVP